jgi:hypothetical protein
MAGYSGTPLPQKLGIMEAHQVAILGGPKTFAAKLGALPTGATVVTTLTACAKAPPRLLEKASTG